MFHGVVNCNAKREYKLSGGKDFKCVQSGRIECLPHIQGSDFERYEEDGEKRGGGGSADS